MVTQEPFNVWTESPLSFEHPRDIRSTQLLAFNFSMLKKLSHFFPAISYSSDFPHFVPRSLVVIFLHSVWRTDSACSNQTVSVPPPSPTPLLERLCTIEGHEIRFVKQIGVGDPFINYRLQSGDYHLLL